MSGAAPPFKRLEAIIHLHSNFSFRGDYSPGRIVELAEEKGIEVVLFTDDAWVKFSYGLFPFRRILNFSVQKDSVFKLGLHRYLSEIDRVQQDHPNSLVFPGLEVIPFYYWEKSPFTFHGIIRDVNKHLTLFGLNEEGFRSLPLAGRSLLPLKPFRWRDLFRLWGVIPLVLAIYLFRRSSRWSEGAGLVLLIVGGIALIENYPYRDPAVTIYGPEGKTLPYQRLIDDVRGKGGLVFWAHPEGKTIPYEAGPVTFLTDPYPEALKETDGYTGFAILFEGMKTIGVPGGIWDQLLNDYCQGKRKEPIWATGELDYTSEGRSGTWIDTVKTVLYCRQKDHEGVFEALRHGRMYAMRRSRERELLLDEMWVGEEGGKTGFLGEEITLSKNPKIHFALSSSDGYSEKVQVRIIRSGEILQDLELRTPIRFTYQDPERKEGKFFYRLEVTGDDRRILTNPVFVELQ